MYYTDKVAKELSEKHTVTFLHFGSTVHRYLPKERSNKALQTYKDRSENDKYYDSIIDYEEFNKSLDSAVKKIDPSVSVFIAIHSFPMRWGNYISRERGVKTLHFMHGVKMDSEAKNNSTSMYGVYKKLPRVIYYTKLYYQYVKDVVTGGVEAPPLGKILYDYYELIFRHSKYDFNPKYKYTVKYDTVCVTNKKDVEYFNKKYSMNSSKKVVVGHTDMDDILEGNISKRGENNRVLYASQPLTDNGVSVKSIANKVCEISNQFESKNYEFFARPHPRDNVDIIKALEERGVKISRQGLTDDILGSCVVVGVTSTLLLTAKLLNIPILSISFSEMPRPTFLCGYPYHVQIGGSDGGSIGSAVKKVIEYTCDAEAPDLSEMKKPSKKISSEILSLVSK